MASEQVNRIVEAEKKAAGFEHEARVKADEILANAQKQAQKEHQDALSAARKHVADLYEKHKSDGSDENSASDSAAEKAAEKSAETVQNKKDTDAEM